MSYLFNFLLAITTTTTTTATTPTTTTATTVAAATTTVTVTTPAPVTAGNCYFQFPNCLIERMKNDLNQAPGFLTECSGSTIRWITFSNYRERWLACCPNMEKYNGRKGRCRHRNVLKNHFLNLPWPMNVRIIETECNLMQSALHGLLLLFIVGLIYFVQH